MMQKLLLAILIVSRKRRPYFESHPETMVSQYNLRSPLKNSLAMGRISWWAMELQGFGLKFEHMNNIKSHALADFMAEWTETEFDRTVEESSLPGKEDPCAWIMHFDGSFSRNKGGAGVVLDSPTGDRLKYVVHVLYSENITNNGMEYVVSQKSDTGCKGYPFLGSAWGAKEAVDLFTRRKFVGGQRAETRKQTHSDLPMFRPPEG